MMRSIHILLAALLLSASAAHAQMIIAPPSEMPTARLSVPPAVPVAASRMHTIALVSVGFGTVPIGTPRDTVVTFIRNISFQPETIYDMYLTGEYAARFGMTKPGVPFVIPPGDSVRINFTFTPATTEFIQAEVGVVTDHDTITALLFGRGRVVSAIDEERAADDGLRITPNPASATAVIEYDIEVSGSVRLDVVDLTGRTLATLVDDVREAGRHTVSLDGIGLPSGQYRCVLRTRRGVTVAPLNLVR